jgi:hypothetical protein
VGSFLPGQPVGRPLLRPLRETTSEASRLKATVSAWSRKSWPATPSTNTIGRKTETVVRVEAVTAMATSREPLAAASKRSSPPSRCRKMFSRTTIELSTSSPTPSASPPRLIMLREMPEK